MTHLLLTWQPQSGGSAHATYADSAYQLGCDDGWWDRPAVPPAAWPSLASDYRSGWIAGQVAREQARGKREVA